MTQITHTERVDAAFARATKILKDKLSGADSSWRVLTPAKQPLNDITVSRLEVENSPLGILHAEGIFEGFDSLQFFALIRSPDYRKKWDQLFASASTKFTYDPNNFLAHSSMKPIFPVSARDLCVVLRYGELEDQSKYFFAVSVEDPLIPLISSNVRAHAELALWTVRDMPGDTISTRVTYTVQSDPNGWIPAMVTNMIGAQIPRCVQSVYELLKKEGGAPFFINSSFAAPDGRFPKGLMRENTYLKNNILELDFAYKGSSSEIAAAVIVDPAFCPSGASFTVQRDGCDDLSLNFDVALLPSARAKLFHVSISTATDVSQEVQFKLIIKSNDHGSFRIIAEGKDLSI